MLNTIKNFMLGFALLMTFQLSANTFNTEPTNNGERILKVEESKCSLDIATHDNIYFNSITYCNEFEKICFNAKANIEFMQVLDQNQEVVMMLPVEASNTKVSINELSAGQYTLNFIITGVNDIVSTNFVMN